VKYRVLALTALVVLVLDQLTKWWIASNLEVGKSFWIIEGFVRLRHTHNTGAAFGIFQDSTGVLSILSLVIISGILIAFVRWGNLSKLSVFAAGLIVGGALGNLVDRVRLGYVVDFIDVYNPHLDIGGTIYTFPVFNVGDSGITIGVILIMIGLLFGKEEQRLAERQSTRDDKPSTTSQSPTSTPNQTHRAG
jgi:signal peptidase II